MAPPPRRQQVAIVFGYDGAEYTTSTGAVNGQGSISGHARARSDDNLNKECHVVFGEPGREKRDFTISSAQANPTGEMHKYTAKLPSDAKHMLVKTSSSYGTDPPNYTTSTQVATYYSKAAAQESIALRNEIRKRTGPRPTRGMSYDDVIEYVSESKSQFENKCKDHKPSVMAEAVKNGARLLWSVGCVSVCCHSVFGGQIYAPRTLIWATKSSSTGPQVTRTDSHQRSSPSTPPVRHRRTICASPPSRSCRLSIPKCTLFKDGDLSVVSSSLYTLKLSPQPQLPLALGFSKTNSDEMGVVYQT
jgi:hypothetical protein